MRALMFVRGAARRRYSSHRRGARPAGERVHRAAAAAAERETQTGELVRAAPARAQQRLRAADPADDPAPAR